MIQVTELDRADGCVIAAVSGAMDYLTGPDFRAAANGLLDPPGRRLVLEMSCVDFLDSSGLNELLRLSKQTARGGGSLVLAGALPRVRQILSLTGADTVLPVYARAADALGESS
jgi:anti-anti-sigma factor